MVEFKKGLSGIETAIDSASTAAAKRSTPTYTEVEEREEITAPRFQPPPAEPRLESSPPLHRLLPPAYRRILPAPSTSRRFKFAWIGSANAFACHVNSVPLLAGSSWR